MLRKIFCYSKLIVFVLFIVLYFCFFVNHVYCQPLGPAEIKGIHRILWTAQLPAEGQQYLRTASLGYKFMISDSYGYYWVLSRNPDGTFVKTWSHCLMSGQHAPQYMCTIPYKNLNGLLHLGPDVLYQAKNLALHKPVIVEAINAPIDKYYDVTAIYKAVYAKIAIKSV